MSPQTENHVTFPKLWGLEVVEGIRVGAKFQIDWTSRFGDVIYQSLLLYTGDIEWAGTTEVLS